MREQILAYALKYQGEYWDIKKAINNHEKFNEVHYQGNYITILDERYPKVLFDLEHPPFILFYCGQLDLLDIPSLGIVGSRQCTTYGITMVEEIVSNCSSRCIVSGLAKGIDAYAHKFALDAHKHTIAVIGCGLDIVYPKENEALYLRLNHELILSEYPNGTPPLAHHFPWRNRLLAALSHRIVVVEASLRSGTMLTVNEALILNRDVYVVPYHYGEKNGKGCNLLIQQGANVIINEEDLVEL